MCEAKVFVTVLSRKDLGSMKKMAWGDCQSDFKIIFDFRLRKKLQLINRLLTSNKLRTSHFSRTIL